MSSTRNLIEIPGDADSVRTVEAHVIKYNATGIIDVDVFNERELDGQAMEDRRQAASDNALFGTHVREAARILRGR